MGISQHSDATTDIAPSPAVATPQKPLPDAGAGKTLSEDALSALVAPFLEEAMEHDGRGNFGCVSVSPGGWFMQEDDALEVIRFELAAVGLNLQKNVRLDNIRGPVYYRENECTADVRVESRSMHFDWADTTRGIYIDFLGRIDWDQWRSGSPEWVWSVNFPDLARRVADAYGAHKGKDPVTFGIFFDPLASNSVLSPKGAELPPGIKSKLHVEYEKYWRKESREHSKWRLRLQVQHFIEYLRSEGLLDAGE